MNAPDLLFALAETTFWVGLLVAGVLLIRKPFARFFGARAAYALWLAPALRLFLPEFKILSAPIEHHAVYAYALRETGPVTPGAASFDVLGVALAAALFLWFAVAFALIALRLGGQRRATREALAHSETAPAELVDEVAAAAARVGLKTTPLVRLSNNNRGPMVFGVFRPVVVAPADFMTAYSTGERALALAHECAHIARGDMLARTIAFLLQAAQWPNPVVHIAARAFETDQEAACDAYVLARCRDDDNAVGDYASAIMKSVRGATAPAYALSLGHPLKERLMLLTRTKPSIARRLSGGAGAATLIAAGLAATASYGFAASEVEESEEAVTERRVLILKGEEDEVIFDDVEVGDRVRVLEFEGDDGRKRVIRIKGDERIVRVFGENGELLTEDIHATGHHGAHFSASCTNGGEDGEPVMLEWRDESGDDGNKRIEHTVICLTGEDADPENRAEALRKAIDRIEADAKEKETRRKEMVKSLRKQLRDIEKSES